MSDSDSGMSTNSRTSDDLFPPVYRFGFGKDSVMSVVHEEADPIVLPPTGTLPRPTCWSTFTHPDIFKDYIDAENRIRTSGGPSSSTDPHKPIKKANAQIHHAHLKNVTDEKILCDVDYIWVSQFFFKDSDLPAPFQSSLLTKDEALWGILHEVGNSYRHHTFREFPDLGSEKAVVQWLNHISNALGILHGLVSTSSPDEHNPRNVRQGCGDRVFSCEVSDGSFGEGLTARKSGIFVVDRQIVGPQTCLRWPFVQALVEVSTDSSQGPTLLNTLIEKASNMFETQPHRRYVPGLALLPGEGDQIPGFFLVLVDRIGVICTEPIHMDGYDALSLARILYAFAFGSNKILGMDPRVTIDRFTGGPKSVIFDKQTLKIITEIHASPFIFGRGTRVYIVEDEHGRFHILKDSWAKYTDTDSEIEHVKKISDAGQGLAGRFRILCPRLVASEDNVDITEEHRCVLTSYNLPRIRRRMVTGPIGDPITSYRSRVEFLQVMIDVVDQLKFIHDECDLVHSDISMNNIVIVRFLPNILAALPPPFPETLNFSASQQITPCHKDGFPHVLKSGGSVIDFDCARASGTPAAEVSMTGSTPYTAIELMKPSSPIAHQLKHDLESVFLVLLNIVRFTWGPGATGDERKVKPHFRVSQWHHERSVERLKDLKKIDVRHVCKDPMPYLTDYWAPIAPFMQRLYDIFYPVARITESQAVYNAFKAVLIDAQNFCKTILEFVPNYAAFWNLESLRKQTALDDDSSDDES